MAHAAKISELTDALIQSVAGIRSQHASYRRMREQAAKTFRNTTHSRTNQFDVQSKLNGLVEKFAVLNREDLSDALQARLEEIPANSKWMPEILSLLLQLSDRPLEKTKIEDVEALTKSSEDEQPGLTWDDLIAERALDEPGLWDDVERGYHSSGDEANVDDEAESVDTTSTKATSHEDDTIALARLHIVQPDDSALEDYESVRDPEPLSRVSELTLIRDTLSMLRGLPTNLFLIEASGSVSTQPNMYIETAARSTIHNLILDLSETGTALNALRQWAVKPEAEPYLQSCQAATSTILLDFDRELSSIERRYVAPKQDQIVSLINVRSEVGAAAKSLLRLSRIVTSASDSVTSSPFALLDTLNTEISIAEMSGDEKLFSALAQVCLAGLRTYLRPISMWIQSGIVESDNATSMIRVANPDCDPGNLWYERYALRTLPNGDICAPRALHGFAQRIFAIGKGQAFLQAVNGFDDQNSAAEHMMHSINSLSDSVGETQLLPFSQLLDEALEAWITETSNDSRAVLQDSLLHKYGVLHTVDRLQDLFCSRDGVLFQTFANTVYWRIDRQQRTWKHNFLLSELASSILASSKDSEAECLTVQVKEASSQSSICQIGAIRLQTMFSWPVQNITRSRTSATHSDTFALLLQTYRAKYLLRSHVLDLKTFAPDPKPTTRSVCRALALRQRLLFFVDVMHNHIATTTQVLHSSLRQELKGAADIDAMTDAWAAHIKAMDTVLLLAQKFKPIRETITNCFELCERFASLWGNAGQSGNDINNGFAVMQEELDRSISFITAGVRSVGRASGSRMLEELAERLDWTLMKL